MFKLPEEVKNGINKFDEALKELLDGKSTADRFKGVRVPWGFYSHRGGKVFMSRLRIPAGILTAKQLKALAYISEKYGSSILHITSRQDIQVHNVGLKDMSEILKYLKEYDLSPRGGGGNTVRNITACSAAGVCPKEIFDVSGDAVALTESLLREENSFTLPRKYKISFSGCDRDWRSYLANDLAFLAKIKDGSNGYQVYVGGGMGADSRMAKVLEEFILPGGAANAAEAVKNVFNSHGDRKNRHHNRLRFLIESMGFDEFKKLYHKEKQLLEKTNKIIMRKINVSGRSGIESDIAHGEGEEYREFLSYNVLSQKQKGYSNVELRIPRGDITSKQAVEIAGLEQDFSGIDFRTSQNQNLIICWVRNGDLYKLFIKLNQILPEFLYPGTILDVDACKGALTCNLGICNSPGLATEVEKLLKEEFVGTQVFNKLDIRINGCPNACAKHPLGKISFYGMAKKIDNRPYPFYKLLIGGMKGKFAEEIGALPAKNVPAFLRDLLKGFEEELINGKNVNEFLQVEGKKMALEILGRHLQVPDDRIDWGDVKEFSLAGIGPGECGAGVVDIIESDIKEAKKSFEEEDFYKALVRSSRALLVVKGLEPKTDSEVLLKFKESFVEEGIVSYRFRDVSEVALAILKNDVSKEKAIEYVKKLLEEVTSAYQGMDSNFKFPVKQEIKEEAEKISQPSPAPIGSGHPLPQGEGGPLAGGEGEILMDLRGVACPINYVKAKIKLETMETGARLLLYLDKGEPIQNVPASFRNDGQDVEKVDEKDGYFEVLVKKVV